MPTTIAGTAAPHEFSPAEPVVYLGTISGTVNWLDGKRFLARINSVSNYWESAMVSVATKSPVPRNIITLAIDPSRTDKAMVMELYMDRG